MDATLSTHIEWVEDPESEGLSSLGLVLPPTDSTIKSTNDRTTDLSTHDPISNTTQCHQLTEDDLFYCDKSMTVDKSTGEIILTRAQCDNARCLTCAPARAKHIARVAAWSLEDAPFVYLVTITPVDPAQWPAEREALLRLWRKETGSPVEAFSTLEHSAESHAHMVVWSAQPLTTFTKASMQVKRDKNTYFDRYSVLLYLMKTIETDQLKHLNLNSGRLLWWSRGAFKGFSGFKDARTQYHAQGGWKRGSAPSRAIPEPVETPETVHDEFKQRQTVSKPVRRGVRAAVRRQPRRELITPTAEQLSEFLDSLTFEDQTNDPTNQYNLPVPLKVELTRTRPPGHSVEHEEETSQGAQNDPPNPRRERWPRHPHAALDG